MKTFLFLTFLFGSWFVALLIQSGQSDADVFSKYLSNITNIGLLIAAIVTFVWYVWSGKSRKQLEADLERAEKRNVALESEIKDGLAKIAKQTAQLVEYRTREETMKRKRRNARSVFLKLVAKLNSEDAAMFQFYDEDEVED